MLPSPQWAQLLLLSVALLATDSASHASPFREGRGSEAVQFDVPAVLEAKLFNPSAVSPSSSHKLIAVTIPVTSEISRSEQGNVHAFRFDTFWNRNAYPISDYAPRTQTTSEIVGPIAVDKTNERSSNHDLKISGAYPPFATAAAIMDGGKREATNLRYSEIPQHEILVASGTVRRGTGAFFRFHPSRAETLEGGRDLLLVFKVPQSWRGGVLQVECTAFGSRRILGWKEPYEIQRAFIVPVYLENDEDAEQSAMEFAQREFKLRQSWNQFQTKTNAAKTSASNLDNFFGASLRQSNKPALPDDWVHALIQVNDQPLERFKDRLPTELANAATKFVESRTNHLKLSR